jgi:hypothetical protein
VTTNVRLTPAYASLSRRKQDVRILAFSTRANTYRIRLPAGAKVISAPPNVSKRTPFGSYSVQVEHKPGEVVVTSRLSVEASRIEPREYPKWRQFCTDADQAMAHRLIVSR